MMALGHHRANFSWALNKYNSTDDPSEREKFARLARAGLQAKTPKPKVKNEGEDHEESASWLR
jgi:hypothetical protein